MIMLISLYPGYGLGDAVQMSVVLRHVRKYRPDWIIDFVADPGRESVGRGICRNVLAYGDPYPSAYDAEVQIVLYNTFANWHDRPNTRVTSCLHERFGIEWDRECSRYQILVRPETKQLAKTALRSIRRPVAIHYQGDSAPEQKNLSVDQATRICEAIKLFGCTPLIFDWRIDLLSIKYAGLRSLGLDVSLGRDAEINCALISECEAYIGIDSGPGKCASATETPTLITWTGHHPSPFHDPSPNTTHLVPVGYHGLAPVCDDPGVIVWFEANYSVIQYQDPVEAITSWLQSTLCKMKPSI